MEKVSENLSRIHSRWRRITVSAILSAFMLAGRVYMAMKRARPSQMIFPATCAQFVLFVFSLRFEVGQGISILAIGTFIIVGIAMLPSTLQRPRYHWIGPSELES